MRVYCAPQPAAKTGNNAIPLLIMKSRDKDNPVWVAPHRLGFIEIDPMLSFICLAFVGIKFKGHK
jgi:hypothetical protein